ncbi:MAG: MauE/DoxX family redox-associated membrane protein, partial [Actinomycetota bacterium]
MPVVVRALPAARARRLLPWAATAGRLLLGGVWVAAGALKLPDPAASVRAVRAYRLLPEGLVPTVAFGLPVLEIGLGVLLIL